MVKSLICDQQKLGGIILLEAPESSKAWKLSNVGKLSEGSDWYPTTVRWCELAIRDSNEAPSVHCTYTRACALENLGKYKVYLKTHHPCIRKKTPHEEILL